MSIATKDIEQPGVVKGKRGGVNLELIEFRDGVYEAIPKLLMIANIGLPRWANDVVFQKVVDMLHINYPEWSTNKCEFEAANQIDFYFKQSDMVERQLLFGAYSKMVLSQRNDAKKLARNLSK